MPTLTARRPDERVASVIAREFCGREPQQVRRFAMGIGHWVYDVQDSGGGRFVVRVGSPDQTEDFVGAAHWSRLLRALGVPLPDLLATGTHQGFPYVVLERLAGEDLGLVYGTLELEQKKAIAEQVFAVQRLVASLGDGEGYGYVKLPGAPARASWRQVIDDSIRRSHSRLESAGGAIRERFNESRAVPRSWTTTFRAYAPRRFSTTRRPRTSSYREAGSPASLTSTGCALATRC